MFPPNSDGFSCTSTHLVRGPSILDHRLTTVAMISAQVTPIVIILSAIYWTKGGEGLSVAEAFTSLSIVSLVTQPLVMILVSLMQIAGVTGGCGRIQAFLLLDEHSDGRSSVQSTREVSSPIAGRPTRALSDKEANPTLEIHEMHQPEPESSPTVAIKDASFQTDDGVALLKNVDLTVARGTLNMIIGKVGCGKSSLLKAIIGEIVALQGTVMAEDSLAYCDQIAWLRNTTIRDNIAGHSPLDEKWLVTVIQSCALDEDLSHLPQGDRTIVGSGGIALSGGQKQRVVSTRQMYRDMSNDFRPWLEPCILKGSFLSSTTSSVALTTPLPKRSFSD